MAWYTATVKLERTYTVRIRHSGSADSFEDRLDGLTEEELLALENAEWDNDVSLNDTRVTSVDDIELESCDHAWEFEDSNLDGREATLTLECRECEQQGEYVIGVPDIEDDITLI